MRNLTKTYFDLIDIIEKQSNIIKHQGDAIADLLNERAEQESFINGLFEGAGQEG